MHTAIVPDHIKRMLITMWLCLMVMPMLAQLPAWYHATVRLRLRTLPSTQSARVTTVSPGTRLKVVDFSGNWAQIEYNGHTVYAYGQYLAFEESIEEPAPQPLQSEPSSTGWKLPSISQRWSWIWTTIGSIIGVLILRKIFTFLLGLFSIWAYKLYWILSFPFYILNALQRHLSKPWRIFFKQNSGNDSRNEQYRTYFEYAKIPLYILLTPLRFVNALYYNIVIHGLFEMFYYLCEVIVPSNKKEGADNLILWLIWLSIRIFRYPLYHGTLMLVESAIWTVIDTFVPALTLFHGTNRDASWCITCSPERNGLSGWNMGVWNVGNGNFAGNGIYFAPSRSTALHYARGALIVTRVTLGRVLDLGMAPWHIYRQCGHPDAIGATDWGLKHGYVTGEWWRGDPSACWWEYCMYDWQNRYNFSFRIRPLYVLDLEEHTIQRIPGGMAHWLFRGMVLKDIYTYFTHAS